MKTAIQKPKAVREIKQLRNSERAKKSAERHCCCRCCRCRW